MFLMEGARKNVRLRAVHAESAPHSFLLYWLVNLSESALD
jgi:hypothetical protein